MPTKQFLRAREAASYLGISAQTLARWRCHGDKIPFSRIGGAVVYDIADLDEFAARHRRRSTSEEAAPGSIPRVRARPTYASGAELVALKENVSLHLKSDCMQSRSFSERYVLRQLDEESR